MPIIRSCLIGSLNLIRGLLVALIFTPMCRISMTEHGSTLTLTRLAVSPGRTRQVFLCYLVGEALLE